MTSRRGSFAVAGRIARREVRRHPWRHLLVVGLIYLPVLAALGCFSAVASWQAQEQHRSDLTSPPGGGRNFCCATLQGGKAVLEPKVADLLPDDARTEPWRTGGDWLVTDMARPDGRGPKLVGTEVYEATTGSAASPLFAVREGRLPATADEVFLTEPTAEAGGWSVGDRVPTVRGDAELRVVGTGVLTTRIDATAAAVADQPDAYWRQLPVDLSTIRLADGRVSSTEVQAQVAAWAETPGAERMLQQAFGSPDRSFQELDARVGPGLTLAAAGICAVVAVIASAAFAIASRRQLRSVGLLSTVGTDPATIRLAMVLQGAIPGLLAGAAAVLTGVVTATAVNAADVVERTTGVVGSRVVLSWSGAAIAVLLALGAGIGAAWQPARTLSRIPVLSALAGRRPQKPVPAGVPTAGLILWAVGACFLALAFGRRDSGILHQAQPFLVILGVAAVALGAVGIAPLLVAALEPLSRRRRGTGRLALRGLSRQRTQSAATVAAIAVVLALPVGLLTTRNTLDDPIQDPARRSSVSTTEESGAEGAAVVDPAGVTVAVRGDLRSDAASAMTAEVAEVLGPDAALIRTVALPSPSNQWRLVGRIDEADAARALEPWAAEAIAAGHAVALRDGGSHLVVTSEGTTADLETVRAPDGGLGTIETSNLDYLVGTEALAGIGDSRPADSIIVVRAAPRTATERDELRRIAGWETDVPDLTLGEIQRTLATDPAAPTELDPSAYLDLWDHGGYEGVPDHSTQDLALAAAAAVSLLLALLVLTITLSLRNVDGEADQRAALAAGMAPASLRRQRAREGVALALLGAVLALPLGWIPVQAARLGVDATVPHTIDGQEVMISFASPGWLVIPILLVPAVVAAVAWTVVPALAARVRRLRHPGPVDLIAPRW